MPNYVTLGNSGLKVSPICLGTMNFGNEQWGCDEPTSAKIIDAYLGAGHNFIDTANVYAGGRSEEIVGRVIASRRDDVVLATKGFNPDGPGPNNWGNTRANLTRSLENSLRRLGTDYVDLYQCHAWDPTTPVEETMATLDGFVRDGKVRYIGCSNWLASQIVEAQNAARQNGGAPLVSLQPQYSLIVRDIEIDILPTAKRARPRRHRLVAARRRAAHRQALEGEGRRRLALRQGRRRRHLGDAQTFAVHRQELRDRRQGRTGREGLGTTHTSVAVAWTLAQDGVTSAIIGPRTAEQLEDNLVAGELRLSDEILKDLDRASRGPLTYAGFLQRGR